MFAVEYVRNKQQHTKCGNYLTNHQSRLRHRDVSQKRVQSVDKLRPEEPCTVYRTEELRTVYRTEELCTLGSGLKRSVYEFVPTMKLLFMFLSLLHLSAGDPRLVCPETVETRIGDNVLLPCHLEPEVNIQHYMVEVTKVDSDVLVYSYYNGRQFADFYEPYKHRTSLNTEELKNGVVNLKIFSVRQSDKGKYRIYISTWRINSIVNLVVGNPLLVCQETVEARISDNITLPCHMEPKQSIEDKTITCRRAVSEVLVYAPRTKELLANYQYRHRTSVNIEELKIGVLNLKIFSVRKSDNGTFNIYIPKWRINSIVTLIVVDPPSRDRLGVIVVVLVVVLCVYVWILVKRRKIRTCWREMMMKRRAQMTEHEDEDQHVDAGNDHLDPEQRAEMLELHS